MPLALFHFIVLRQLQFAQNEGVKRGVDSGLYGHFFKRGDVSGVNGRVSKRAPASCTPEYQKLGHSTMCEYEDHPEAKNMGKFFNCAK